MKSRKKPQLLVVGPLPPPLAGTSVSFDLFCEFVKDHSDKLKIEVINSAPRNVGEKPLMTTDNLFTAIRILMSYLGKIWKSDQVIIFGSDKFLLSLMPLCLGIAKLLRKPCYVRVFGGSLDKLYLGLSPQVRKYFHWTLKHADGVIVQTVALQVFFTRFFGDKVHHVPGYRLMQPRDTTVNTTQRTKDVLRLVYVGHIREEKGVFDLLDSLKMLTGKEQLSIECDLYGPIYSDVAERFKQEIASTPPAHYKGILQPHDVVSTITRYDAFVFPSFYKGEGHPGVLIEAMASGVPIITTNFRSIPELVEHGVNGLLVAPNNPQELMAAIRGLRDDPQLLADMSERSYKSSEKYSSTQVIPQLLNTLGIQI